MIASDPDQIVVTGIGAFSAAGETACALWEAALAGRSSAVWMVEFGDGREVACCRAGTPVSRRMPRAAFERLDRFAQLGVAAAEEAWEDAGLADSDMDPRRIGVVVGSSRGPTGRRERSPDREKRRVRPTAALYSTVSSLAGSLSALTGARGPSLTVSATCASSASAIGTAAQMIRTGTCDVLLVGGADAPLVVDVVAEMQASGVVGCHDDPARLCRPFDRTRNGIVVGEAGAFLVLERAATAARRGAAVRARLSGWSMVCDAGHRSGMSDDARGVWDALMTSLDAAQVGPASVDAVHVHGTGTVMNDAAEARVLYEMFGDRSGAVACTSTKPVTGHCLGASGALQAVINVRALEEQCLPPTVNCDVPDNDVRIRIVHGEPYHGSIDVLLTHSAGFWGNHAGLLFRRA